MSLLSPDLLSVFVSPGALVAVRRSGLGGKIIDKRSVAVVAGPGKNWEAAAQAFADLLRTQPACRRVKVVLSSHFTAYQLLPWRDDLNDRDEELAVARIAFAETYGAVAAQWQLRLADEAPGRAKLAAAVDSDLLAALERAASANQATLVALQPSLVAVVNHWRTRFDRNTSAWIVVHEAGRLCVALIERGAWRWVRSLRAGDDWCESLPDLLDNETLLAGIADGPAHALIFSPAAAPLAVRAPGRWSLRSLQIEARANFSPVSDGPFAVALVG